MFADYLELRLAVAELTGRRDLSDIMPSLVQRAESRMNRKLRQSDQITTATVTMVAGVGDLPEDFIEAIEVKSGTCIYPQVTPIMADRSYSSNYAVKGNPKKLYLTNFVGDLTVMYYAKLPTLTTTVATTNWLLEEAPDVYLYAVAREVAIHVKDKELRDLMAGEYRDALGEIKSDNRRRQYGNAVVQVEGPTP